MPLTLTIENETTLPDGGPVSVTLSGKRGIDIGRDRHLDWTLPDPSRQISGKHCEIRFRDGEYWLTDVSTNGTYVNGSDTRVQSPLRLRAGDRLAIGHYLIRVDVTAADAEAPPAPGPAARAPAPLADPSRDSFSPWDDPADAPPAAPVEDVRPARPPRQGSSSFPDWAADIPAPAVPPRPPARSEPARATGVDDASWLRPASVPPVPPAPPQPPAAAPLPPAPVAPPPPIAGPAPSQPGPMPEPVFPPADDPAVFPPEPPRASPPPPGPTAAAPAPVRPAEPRVPVAAEPPPMHTPGPDVFGPAPAHPAPAFAAGPAGQSEEVIARLAAGLGIPPEIFAGRSAGDVAEDIGQTLRLVTENLRQLLTARAQAKQMVRSVSHTSIQALDNNPLKFAPTTDQALRVMFGPPTPSFLPGDKAFAQAFSDLKSHQVKTYSAMQTAIMRLEAELSPDSVESAVGKTSGLGGILGSRKAQLWDVYAARWQAKTAHREHGLADAFMLEFADSYDQQ